MRTKGETDGRRWGQPQRASEWVSDVELSKPTCGQSGRDWGPDERQSHGEEEDDDEDEDEEQKEQEAGELSSYRSIVPVKDAPGEQFG